MGDILTINGTNFCNNTTNVNGVTPLHTLNVDAIPKNCEPVECYPCGTLEFAFAEADMGDCSFACSGECGFYYTKDYGQATTGVSTGCTECSLQIGVPLYQDTACTPVKDGYYSPKNCDVDCERCYTVTGGLISAIGTCPESCKPCGKTVSLSYNADSCVDACANTNCKSFYTDGNCLICPLIVGNYLYLDEDCTPVAAGYYSPKQCTEDPCEYCYTVDATGKITAIVTCGGIEPTCRQVLMTIIAQEDCKGACEDSSCVTRYTNRAEGELIQPGDFIYDNSECLCEGDSFWESSEGFWQVWYYECNTSPIAPYYNQCIYKRAESCEVESVEDCSKVTGPGDIDGPAEASDDEHDGHA